jgi:hypothetical protein
MPLKWAQAASGTTRGKNRSAATSRTSMRLRYLEPTFQTPCLGSRSMVSRTNLGPERARALKFGYSTCEWHNNFTEYQ